MNSVMRLGVRVVEANFPKPVRGLSREGDL